MTNEPAGVLSLCLLSAEPLCWDGDALVRRLANVELIPSPRAGEPFQIVPTSSAEQTPPTLVITPGTLDRILVEKARRQTWDWAEAGAAVEPCRFATTIADRFARQLPYRQRWDRLRQSVAALIETVVPLGGCGAIHAPQIQRLVELEAFLEGQRPGGDHLCGTVNVRLFKVADRGPDCYLMDTLGLASLGLPDLQCVSRGLDPNEVAALLWDYAYYLYEKGDVIADGEVIKGLKDGEHWTCAHQQSLAEPSRVVLDVYPGPEHDPG